MSRLSIRQTGALTTALVVSLLWLGCTADQRSPTTPEGSAALEQAALDQTVLGLEEVAVKAAVRAQESQTPRLMAISGVVGTGVGLGSNGKPVVKVLVKSEDVTGLPSTINGVRVELLVTGEFFALQEARVSQEAPAGPRAKPTCGKGNLPDCPPPGEEPPAEDPPGLNEWHPRPVPIGVSTGHPAITAGTLGARVKSTSGPDVFALSNNHVYADVNDATSGDAVIQPGKFDEGSSPADDIGTLADFEPIDFSSSGCPNVIDAAIAATTTLLVGNGNSTFGYGTPRSTTMAAAVNMKVKKVGRTTGLTKGTVQVINATVNVNYGAPNGVACFKDQIIVTPGTFSAGGDSGSLVVVDGKGRNKNNDRKPIGLLYAGSAFSTILNPIGPVLDRFDVEIDGASE